MLLDMDPYSRPIMEFNIEIPTFCDITIFLKIILVEYTLTVDRVN